ncbi:Epoxide hydrolase A [Glycine soja]|uniref:Epoxide hydrolase A n=1 Tax=Glycine soja TaxID=3848 RepID=A0A445K184_GLYSO|nr:Epoxide hydrolase 2 [Glycine soja]RZC04489.1 Epoxide hydrolase A [Glycine soja]
MEGIEHRRVNVNGINMHIAEKGEGPLILFIHGFPDLWYSWHHQIAALASLGYRCVAPDLRGYGDTDLPATPTAYTSLHVVGDLTGLLDVVAGDEEKVFVVGHDWGAMTAWSLSLYRSERIKALVNLSVVFTPRNPKRKPLDTLRAVYGNDHYICRFQEPGEIESEFAQIGTAIVLKEFLTYRNPGPLYLPKGGLNYYRNLDLNWELTAPWTGAQVKVPVKFIVGDLDLTYNAPGTKDYIHKEMYRFWRK